MCGDLQKGVLVELSLAYNEGWTEIRPAAHTLELVHLPSPVVGVSQSEDRLADAAVVSDDPTAQGLMLLVSRPDSPLRLPGLEAERVLRGVVRIHLVDFWVDIFFLINYFLFILHTSLIDYGKPLNGGGNSRLTKRIY